MQFPVETVAPVDSLSSPTMVDWYRSRSRPIAAVECDFLELASLSLQSVLNLVKAIETSEVGRFLPAAWGTLTQNETQVTDRKKFLESGSVHSAYELHRGSYTVVTDEVS